MDKKLRNDTIFLVVGKSGSGKTALCDELGQRLGATQVISYTERPQRGPSDMSHEFVTTGMEQWFKDHPGEKSVAHTYFCGYNYWATQKQVDKNNMYVIDLKGVEVMQFAYTGSKTIRIIHVSSTPWNRFKRMVNRGDGVWNALKRLIHDHYAFKGAEDIAHFTVENDDLLENAVQSMSWFMQREDGLPG